MRKSARYTTYRLVIKDGAFAYRKVVGNRQPNTHVYDCMECEVRPGLAFDFRVAWPRPALVAKHGVQIQCPRCGSNYVAWESCWKPREGKLYPTFDVKDRPDTFIREETALIPDGRVKVRRLQP